MLCLKVSFANLLAYIVLQGVAGKNASKKFRKCHWKTTLAEYSRLRIGDLGSEKKKSVFFRLELQTA